MRKIFILILLTASLTHTASAQSATFTEYKALADGADYADFK